VLHVFARGNNRQDIFFDDADRLRYLASLGNVVRYARWHCLAYCLMTNHVHLLLETPERNLGVGVQRLHGGYAQTFNRRHDRCGHLFENRYGLRPVRDEAHLWKTIAYIARNPVSAGLCDDPRRWRWSSHGAAHRRQVPEWLDHDRLLAYFDALGGDPGRRYREAVDGEGTVVL
jgi:REP element-mobilizing transposase RayT